MADLISRQAALDALRYAQHRFTVADEAGGMGTVKWSEYVIYFATAERVLTELPSAQLEIVRCKDCKRWNTVVDRSKAEYGLCQIRTQLEETKRDDWCSRAERRTDG